MNTIKINTKQPQVVSVSKVPAREETVYFKVINMVYHPETGMFEFGFKYYYLDIENEGQENEVIKEVLVPNKLMGKSFPKQEIDYVASQITPTGDTFSSTIEQYMLAGAIAIVAADTAENWGLTASDWEVTTANNE